MSIGYAPLSFGQESGVMDVEVHRRKSSAPSSQMKVTLVRLRRRYRSRPRDQVPVMAALLTSPPPPPPPSFAFSRPFIPPPPSSSSSSLMSPPPSSSSFTYLSSSFPFLLLVRLLSCPLFPRPFRVKNLSGVQPVFGYCSIVLSTH